MFDLSAHSVDGFIFWHFYLFKFWKGIVVEDCVDVHADLDENILQTAELERKHELSLLEETEKGCVVFLLVVRKEESHRILAHLLVFS